jgi:metal-responsive CopG/Arc/MetJ family transcriptional regulator
MTLELSIPDALAAAAHRVATERGMTRSELFARAVAAFLQSHDVVHTEASRPDETTDPVWTQGWEPPS